ncbi:hypothetical protein I3842_Q098900 [Carya illinoinensis]|uniref:Uncharacterized protein n=2 Tax=Carya illinoinensis TaxID=32201 RepID=A0A922D073_CARIL|nr:hypothetical protein I3842_Q098900 [Carya illinoinensis]
MALQLAFHLAFIKSKLKQINGHVQNFISFSPHPLCAARPHLPCFPFLFFFLLPLSKPHDLISGSPCSPAAYFHFLSFFSSPSLRRTTSSPRSPTFIFFSFFFLPPSVSCSHCSHRHHHCTTRPGLPLPLIAAATPPILAIFSVAINLCIVSLMLLHASLMGVSEAAFRFGHGVSTETKYLTLTRARATRARISSFIYLIRVRVEFDPDICYAIRVRSPVCKFCRARVEFEHVYLLIELEICCSNSARLGSFAALHESTPSALLPTRLGLNWHDCTYSSHSSYMFKHLINRHFYFSTGIKHAFSSLVSCDSHLLTRMFIPAVMQKALPPRFHTFETPNMN